MILNENYYLDLDKIDEYVQIKGDKIITSGVTESTHISIIKYESVNIMTISIKLDNSIYQGTIIDGIHIKHDKKREKFFVITDLYLFRGVSTEKDKFSIAPEGALSFLQEKNKKS